MFERSIPKRVIPLNEISPFREQAEKSLDHADRVEIHRPDLCIAQTVGKYHPQEDRFTLGRMPEKYFKLEQGLRHRLMQKNAVGMQRRLTKKNPERMFDSGTTFLTVFTDGEIVDLSYLGDSEVYLVRELGNDISLELLNPWRHHAKDPMEKIRINNAGGKVKFFDGVERLGRLMLSRALGNNRYNAPDDSKSILSRETTRITHRVEFGEGEDVYLIIATDGMTAGFDRPSTQIYLKTLLENTRKEHPDERLSTQIYLKTLLENTRKEHPDERLSTQIYLKILLENTRKEHPDERLSAIIKQVRQHGSRDDVTIARLQLRKGMVPTYVALFDGHGGSVVADLAMQKAEKIFDTMLSENLTSTHEIGSGSNSCPSSQEVATLPVDEDPKEQPDKKSKGDDEESIEDTDEDLSPAKPPKLNDALSVRALVRQNAFSAKRLRDSGSDSSEEEEVRRESNLKIPK